MAKLTAGIGEYVKMDQATLKEDRLNYATVMLEVEMNQSFPEEIRF